MQLEWICRMGVAAGLLVGCGSPDRPGSNPSGGLSDGLVASPMGGVSASGTATNPAPVRSPTTEGSTTGEQFAGSMGDVRNFTSSAVDVRMVGPGSFVRLDAVVDSGRWWVMTQLQFSRPLSDAAWVPGMTRTFSPGMDPPTDGLMVTAVGCSGTSPSHYTFDARPEQVTVQVTAGSTPDARVIHFQEQWTATGQTVAGSFEYLPR